MKLSMLALSKINVWNPGWDLWNADQLATRFDATADPRSHVGRFRFEAYSGGDECEKHADDAAVK